MESLLESLNDAQRAAVSAPIGPILVLAGAGSGKTRVLTHRAAWLIIECGVSPHGLMAVTFTNKAAAEMRSRIESLLRVPADPLWIGTFHGLSHRMLRRHWREAGLPQHFQILDEDDQQRLVRKIIRELKLDEQRWVPREVQGFINSNKDEGRRAKKLDDRNDPTRQQLIRLYTIYEARCQQAGVVDFAELLLRSYEILRDIPELGDYYRERFRHVLVDEFQDTNGVQYEWLKQLVGKTGAPFVVGDDDQSIYRWRGARVENMQHFKREFGATVFRLEQNYRSTAVILGAANAVIAKNTDRMGKELWTATKGGDPIRVYAAYNERDEADFVIDRIREHAGRGLPLSAAAVLYRSNAQSRAFEEVADGGAHPLSRLRRPALLRARGDQGRTVVPAPDAIARRRHRLRARRQPADARHRRRDARPAACGRARHSRSLWESGLALMPSLPARAPSALRGFYALIDRLATEIAELPLHEKVQTSSRARGSRPPREGEGQQGRGAGREPRRARQRRGGFEPDNDDGLTPLGAFLAHTTLESGETQAATGLDCVQLMTLHAAKGLEFPTVFIVGLEEGLFPSERAAFDADRLPEERRLCYVGLTRAMQRLYLTHAESRRIFGHTAYRDASRFLSELPPEALEDVRPRIAVSRPLYSAPIGHRATAIARSRKPGNAPPSRAGRRSRAKTLPCASAPASVTRNSAKAPSSVSRVPGESRQVHVNFENVGQKSSCTNWPVSSKSPSAQQTRAVAQLRRPGTLARSLGRIGSPLAWQVPGRPGCATGRAGARCGPRTRWRGARE